VVSGQGTAFAFILLALAFLGLFLLGWRLLARRTRWAAADETAAAWPASGADREPNPSQVAPLLPEDCCPKAAARGGQRQGLH
jgi:hypothetical protein